MYFEITPNLSPEIVALWQSDFEILPHAHPFQSLHSLELLSDVERGRFQFFLAWDSPTRSSLTAVGLVRFRRLPFGVGKMTVNRGPLCKNVGELRAVLQGLTAEAERRGAYELVVSPYFIDADCELAAGELVKMGFSRLAHQGGHTASVEVSLENEPEVILKTFNENTRRQIKKADQFELDVSAPENIDEIKSFHELYCRMSAEKGADQLTLDAFLHFYAHFVSHPDQSSILLARKSRKVIAGIMLLNNAVKSWYIYGASDSSAREVPLTFLCHWKAMLQLKARGIQSYDFGGLGQEDSKDDAVMGINRFKKGFSKRVVTKTEEYHRILKPVPHFVFSSGRRIARRLFEAQP